MKDELKTKILKVITTNSQKLKISLHKGGVVQVNAITFSQIIDFTFDKKNNEIQKYREAKQAVLNLISEDAIVELSGEPPYYFFKEEFDTAIRSKENIMGIEGRADE